VSSSTLIVLLALALAIRSQADFVREISLSKKIQYQQTSADAATPVVVLEGGRWQDGAYHISTKKALSINSGVYQKYGSSAKSVGVFGFGKVA
jgi:hypothetical protein